MKRKILCVFLGLSLFAGGAAVASSANGQYKGMEIVKIRVNGTEVHPETPGHIEDGNTVLPIRAVSEALGANIQWHPEDYSADITMPKPGLSLAQLNKIGASVGEVYVLDSSGDYTGQGSGFLLSNGFFITNYHVGAAGVKLRIDLNGKTYNTNGESIFKNADTDLFAVKINADVAPLEYTTTLPQYGAHVYSLGFPHGKFQINDGTVFVSSPVEVSSTARADGGSSGGILIGDDGRIVGITSAGANKSNSNIDYSQSIPMSVLQKEFDKLTK